MTENSSYLKCHLRPELYVSSDLKIVYDKSDLTDLKSNFATNHIQDKDGNIIKNAYSATNKFNEHFYSTHNVFKDPT